MARTLRRPLVFLCATLLLVISVAGAARAQVDGESRLVRVGFSQFPGYSVINQSGLAEGFSIDLIRMLLEPQGYSVSFLPYQNPAEVLEALATGDIDMTALLVDTPQRREFGTFTDHIGAIDLGIMVADGAPIPRSLDDLRGYRIGAAEGSIGFRLLSELEDIIPVPMVSGEAMLLPLLSGEVDAIVGSTDSIRHQANLAGLSHRVVNSDIALDVSPLALLTNPAAETLRADLNTAIARVLASGEKARLRDSWFGIRAAPVSSREALAILAAVITGIIVLAYWAKLHFGTLRRARRLQARAELLADTLDSTGSSLVLFDADMRPEYWNGAFKQNYPRQVPFVESGANMEELITIALQNGSADTSLETEEAAEEAARRVRKLRLGGELTSLNTTETGRTLRRRTMMLPNKKFVTISTDVSELVSAKRALEKTATELADANTRLASFNSMAAHDLVAPLQNLERLHAWIREDLSEMGQELDEDTRQNFADIELLLTRQKTMVEDLLAFSLSDQHRDAKAFDPAERYPAILSLINRPQGFRISLPSQAPMLNIDPVAFDIVLRNLVSNAVKHHDQSAGVVEIRTRTEGDRCVFEVIDDGPGIPPDMLERVFEPFTRLKRRDEGAGTGLGLSFIKRCVTSWGGTVKAISRDGERGTIFRFDAPIAKPDASSRRDSTADTLRPHPPRRSAG